MKIAVVGLGAVGGLLAHRLSGTGHRLVALARGATLDAVRARGLRLRTPSGGETAAPLVVSDDAAALGPQDLVIVALKGPSLAAAAASINALLGRETILMPAMNGVPWWFLQTGLATRDPMPLQSIDPDGRIAEALPLAQVLGCVVHLACSSPEPGVVRHNTGDRLIVGEPGGGGSSRVAAVCDLLRAAGFQAEASVDLRRELWYKLWGNLTMNPISALTGADSDRILDDPLIHAFMLRAMAEAAAIGARVGCPIEEPGEARLAVARQLGGFKTSMLQDLLADRPLELDAIVAAAFEIGMRVGVDAPNIGALLGLTRLMARERGLYPA